MSVIRDIYSYLAGQVISVAGIIPQAFDLSQLPNTVETAILPCRLLTPMSPKGEARDGQFIALGQLTSVTWRLTDLMLWRAVASGIGLEDIAGVLVDYADAYLDMIRHHRSMGQAQCHVTGYRFVYGTFEWPDQSGRWYDGVSCELDIEEFKSGC